MFKIGKVTHYYDKIGMAIVELTGNLTVSEKVIFTEGGKDLFSKIIDGIKIGHRNVRSAGPGDIVGLNVPEPIAPGAEIYKAEN